MEKITIPSLGKSLKNTPKAEEFVEWEEAHTNNYYGTLKV
jgi:guanylate kinase